MTQMAVRSALQFRKRVQEHRIKLIELLGEILFKDGVVLGYGASTKGNVILQYCGLTADDIPYIAEINEEKFGKYTPGTNIPIISMDEAYTICPDYFLVLPWHFKNSIIKREQAYLKRGGKLIFPLPKIEIIGG